MAEAQENYLVGDFETAAHLYEPIANSNPAFSSTHNTLTAICIEPGRKEDAKWTASELMIIAPNFSNESEIEHNAYADPETNRRFIESLRQAGLK